MRPLLAGALIALLASAAPALAPAAPARPMPGPSHCRAGETVVYSCKFGRATGSVCAVPGRISYRFGPLGKAPELAISSTPDWSNVHIGGNRSQGGLDQDHVRFTNGDTHYVVHSGATGSLNEQPGRRISGITVLRGRNAEELASLECRLSTLFVSDRFSSLSDIAPKGWDGWEADDGPFAVIY